jgi:hypothetical protein
MKVRITEPGDTDDWKSSTRGEAAWKDTLDRVASRNAEARKLGKRQREADERRREATRRAAAAKRHGQLLNRRTP